MSNQPRVVWRTDTKRLELYGTFRLENAQKIESALAPLCFQVGEQIQIDASNVTEIDSSGALIAFRELRGKGLKPDQVAFCNLRPEQDKLVRLVQNSFAVEESTANPRASGILTQIGSKTFEVVRDLKQVLQFLGETVLASLGAFADPRKVRIRELFVQLETTCIKAIAVVSLVTLLIGIVVAYLFAGQIQKYGANILVVDAVALAMCRELSPIIVAIIMAGRSGSAFTAQIGAMKLNEELDALTTLGLSPMQVLVLPRVLALALAMPILVFVGDIMGILGGLIIADAQLGITGATFVERLRIILTPTHVIAGLIKAPVFAVFIAVIGCHMGLSVERNARSVGLNTTSTVVQSIVSVILLNALFAVIFVELGI